MIESVFNGFSYYNFLSFLKNLTHIFSGKFAETLPPTFLQKLNTNLSKKSYVEQVSGSNLAASLHLHSIVIISQIHNTLILNPTIFHRGNIFSASLNALNVKCLALAGFPTFFVREHVAHGSWLLLLNWSVPAMKIYCFIKVFQGISFQINDFSLKLWLWELTVQNHAVQLLESNWNPSICNSDPNSFSALGSSLGKEQLLSC